MNHTHTKDCRIDCPEEWARLEQELEESQCAYCGEDGRKNPLKHLNELAKFLKKKSTELLKVASKITNS